MKTLPDMPGHRDATIRADVADELSDVARLDGAKRLVCERGGMDRPHHGLCHAKRAGSRLACGDVGFEIGGRPLTQRIASWHGNSLEQIRLAAAFRDLGIRGTRLLEMPSPGRARADSLSSCLAPANRSIRRRFGSGSPASSEA